MRTPICQKCHKVLREAHPVYLVDIGRTGITGPYHAACAYFVSLERKRGELVARIPSEELEAAGPAVGETT